MLIVFLTTVLAEASRGSGAPSNPLFKSAITSGESFSFGGICSSFSHRALPEVLDCPPGCPAPRMTGLASGANSISRIKQEPAFHFSDPPNGTYSIFAPAPAGSSSQKTPVDPATAQSPFQSWRVRGRDARRERCNCQETCFCRIVFTI